MVVAPDPPNSLTPPHLPRHTPVMAVVYSVLGDSEGEPQAALRTMCDLLDLEPVGRPHDLLRDGKWLGRARLAPEPAED